MNRHGYKLSLTQLDAATWRAMFHRDLKLAQDGFGADRTPWGAVQLAAWSALRSAANRTDPPSSGSRDVLGILPSLPRDGEARLRRQTDGLDAGERRT